MSATSSADTNRPVSVPPWPLKCVLDPTDLVLVFVAHEKACLMHWSGAEKLDKLGLGKGWG